MRFVPLELVPALEATIAAELAHGTWTRQRDALAVALGLHGLRVSEVCQAQAADLFVAGCRLQVRTLKRGRVRELPLHQSLVSALLNWRGEAHTPWLLFARSGRRVHRTQFERAARRLIAQVVGQPLKFHALRHTFAMRLYAEKPDVFLVQRMLGHHSIKSTEVYAASLANVPEACLVRLRADACPVTPVQLRLFSPAG